MVVVGRGHSFVAQLKDSSVVALAAFPLLDRSAPAGLHFSPFVKGPRGLCRLTERRERLKPTYRSMGRGGRRKANRIEIHRIRSARDIPSYVYYQPSV